MIPDAERLVGEYLRAHPDVTARVVGRTPGKNASDPAWIRLTQLDAADDPTSGQEHLIGYLLQLDIYAGGQPEVWTLARAVRAALHAMPGTHGDIVITAVRFTGMARIPDQDFEPARERVVLTTTVYAHA